MAGNSVMGPRIMIGASGAQAEKELEKLNSKIGTLGRAGATSMKTLATIDFGSMASGAGGLSGAMAAIPGPVAAVAASVAAAAALFGSWSQEAKKTADELAKIQQIVDDTAASMLVTGGPDRQQAMQSARLADMQQAARALREAEAASSDAQRSMSRWGVLNIFGGGTVQAGRQLGEAFRELQRLQAGGTGPQAQALQTQLDDPALRRRLALEDERRARAAMAGDINTLTDSLGLQYSTMNMIADEAERFRLSLRGATAQQLESVAAMQNLVDLARQEKEVGEAAARNAEQAFGVLVASGAQLRLQLNPLERINAELERINDMVNNSAISIDDATLAAGRLQDEFIAANEAQNKIGLAQGVGAGSREALESIQRLRLQSEQTGGTREERLQRAVEQQRMVQERQLDQLRDIRRAIEDGGGIQPVDLG